MPIEHILGTYESASGGTLRDKSTHLMRITENTPLYSAINPLAYAMRALRNVLSSADDMYFTNATGERVTKLDLQVWGTERNRLKDIEKRVSFETPFTSDHMQYAFFSFLDSNVPITFIERDVENGKEGPIHEVGAQYNGTFIILNQFVPWSSKERNSNHVYVHVIGSGPLDERVTNGFSSKDFTPMLPDIEEHHSSY